MIDLDGRAIRRKRVSLQRAHAWFDYRVQCPMFNAPEPREARLLNLGLLNTDRTCKLVLEHSAVPVVR